MQSSKTNPINIVFIADDNYVTPTMTAIYSVIKNSDPCTFLNIYILSADMSAENIAIFRNAECENVSIQVLQCSAKKYQYLHKSDVSAPCVASIAALLKFDIPNVLTDIEKVLYLDGDLIVREDLQALYNTDVTDYFLAAVVDSGSIYYRHKYVQQVHDYFNSGVMLLNLQKMREADSTSALIEQKMSSKDSFLMDQNVFNSVFDCQFLPLPIRYNLLYVNLVRAEGKYSISDINKRYKTSYSSLNEIADDAAIIHFSSKDKPWRSEDTPLSEEWRQYFREANTLYHFASHEIVSSRKDSVPSVSVIIPVYNTAPYLSEALDSIANQTLDNIEVICINDGSNDGSLEILQAYATRDHRFSVYSQPNEGQSSARNVGLKRVRGEFVYFFDSDDLLKENALELLYTHAKKDSLDILLFDGETFYDSPELAALFPQYDSYYRRSKRYRDINSGENLYVKMVSNGDYWLRPGQARRPVADAGLFHQSTGKCRHAGRHVPVYRPELSRPALLCV